MGHGFLQGPTHRLGDQRSAYARTVETLANFSGKPITSWECPGLTETEETIDILRELGVEYIADWVIDDLPQEIDTPHGTAFTIPYTVETNDITCFAIQNHPSELFLQRGRDQFDRLYAESADNARIMSISLHPYITGVPHRIRYLEELLDYISGHDGVEWMFASDMGDWYKRELSKHRM
jgi:peptidoglycan/xylan/chitin deacetylase (PgdA/CDA1 family)